MFGFAAFFYRVGDRMIRGGPGSFSFRQRGIPHSFRNVGGGLGRQLVAITPAGFELFFVEVDRVFGAAPPDPVRARELAVIYGLDFLPPGA